MADLGNLNQYDVGLGVRTRELPNGYVAVEIDPNPLKPEHHGACFDLAQVKTCLEEMAVSWLEQVAPHRLAFGAETHG